MREHPSNTGTKVRELLHDGCPVACHRPECRSPPGKHRRWLRPAIYGTNDRPWKYFRDQLIGRTDYFGIERRRHGYRADWARTIVTLTLGPPSSLFNSPTDDPRDRPPTPARPPSALPAS